MAATRRLLGIVLPLALGLLAASAAALLRSPGEGLFLRVLSGLRPPLEAPTELLLLELDEAALEEGGAWPWPRESLADLLLAAAEFGAGRVLLDLGLEEEGPTALPLDLEEFRGRLGAEFDLLERNVGTLFEAIRTGSVKPADSPRYVAELLGLVRGSEERLLALAAPPPDAELALAEAIRLQGRVWLGYGLDARSGRRLPPAALRDFAAGHSLGRREGEVGPAMPVEGFSPPPAALLGQARGAGFSSAGRDEASRPFALLAEYEGELLPSAALLLLRDALGSPQVLVGRTGLLLRRAYRGEGEAVDIPIPLTSRGAALQGRFAAGEEPRRLSLAPLLAYRRLERELLAALEDIEGSGFLEEGSTALERGRAALALEAELLETGEGSRLGELRAARAAFHQAARESLEAEAKIAAYVEGLLAAGNPSEEESRGLLELREKARREFALARNALAGLESGERELSKALASSLCIVGFEGESRAAAAFLAAGLTASFPREAGAGLGILLGGTAALLAGLAGRRFGASAALAAGGGLGLGLFGGALAIFLRFGTYLPPLPPLLACLAGGLAAALIARAERRADRSPASGP